MQRLKGWLAAIFLSLWGCGVVAWPQLCEAKVFLSVEEALALAFPGAEIDRSTEYLSQEQQDWARELSGEEIRSALVHPYTARVGGEILGTAYFDSHKVRTLPETLMVVVNPEGQVHRVEILSFREPEDYIPREVWYEQFKDRPLDEDLKLNRSIHPVTGATLTARATAQAVRRVLALHRVIGDARAENLPASEVAEETISKKAP